MCVCSSPPSHFLCPPPFPFGNHKVGEGNGTPLQCPCLENPRDGGAWWAAVYGVAQSQTLLKRLSSSSGNHKVLCYVVRPFLFGKEVHLYPFLESTSKKYHMILVFRTSLSVIVSTSFLVAGRGVMSPFLWGSYNCSVCIYYVLFTHSSVLTHLGFMHVFATVHNTAMNTGCICLLKLWFSLDLCPGLGLLGPMALRSLVFNDPLSCSPSWI